MDCSTLLDDLTTQIEEHVGYDTGDGAWREDPVTLREFVEGRAHLGLPPLFPRQYKAAHALLGEDPSRIFEEPDSAAEFGRRFQLAVLLWGKGSGKDYLCSILVCYLVHVLLCLRDPQRFFEFGAGEPIDIVNVAYNADQAKRVFFEKLKQRILGWRWLRERYNVFESGRRKGEHVFGRQQVEINDGEVLFPRGIRCFSRHSENESYEGYNVIAWLMDEASAFLSKLKRENAEKIYQTLRTSAASRFGRRWIGFIISYPRHGDDFTVTKHREAERNPELGAYADGPAATWEINERLARGDWVEVRPGFRVPVTLANDFLADFEEALARYCCQPPAARDAFFRYPERLDDAVATGRAPLIEWESIVNMRTTEGPNGEQLVRRYVAVKLTKLGRIPRGTKMFFHGDPGLTSDSFALALGHGVPATVVHRVPAGEVMDQGQIEAYNAQHRLTGEQRIDAETLVDWERDVTRTVIDGLIVWRPDPKLDMQVDLQNVEDVIFELRDRYRLGHPAEKPSGTFDHWNSALTIQRMQSRRMNVEDEHWSGPFQLDIYKNARMNFYNDLVTLPDTPSITSDDPLAPGVLYELKRIELLEGRKVDHPEGGSKDLADAVVRVIQHVTDAPLGGFVFSHTYGHADRHQHRALVSSTERTVDPGRTPGISGHQRDAEAEVREQRPLGELVPAEGTVNGRKLAFGSIKGTR